MSIEWPLTSILVVLGVGDLRMSRRLAARAGVRVGVVSWGGSGARGLRLALALILVMAGAAFAGSASSRAAGSAAMSMRTAASVMAGTWRRLSSAPSPAATGRTVSVWTGRQMLFFGRAYPKPPLGVDVAAAYSPTSNRWGRLAPFKGPAGNFQGHYSAVWTGQEMLVFGPFDFQAYDPSSNRWRRLPAPPTAEGPSGLVVWTGHEMIYWGGGCCGDSLSNGAALNPATNAWRKLARSPLAPSQTPTGVWTGRELIIFVSGLDPDGKPYPATLARAAAYNPATNTWRRIAPLPTVRYNATAVWDGREVLVAGGYGAPQTGKPATLPRIGFAYNPGTDHWRPLAPMNSGRTQFAAVWTGKRLLIWGGNTTLVGPPQSSQGIAFDPTANRWSALPQAPLSGRASPTAVWTGHAMILWGGASASRPYTPIDGAAFTPTTW